MRQSSFLMGQFVVHIVEAPVVIVMGGADIGNNWARVTGLLVVRHVSFAYFFSTLQ